MAHNITSTPGSTAESLLNQVTSELINLTLSIKDESQLEEETISVFRLWLFGAGAVIFISVVGLAAIMMIPMIYHHHVGLVQLLVGLAIGTLTGDALLHLLPHALMDPHHSHQASAPEHHDHDHHSHDHEINIEINKVNNNLDPHTKSVIYGLMSLIGIVGLLIFERVLTIVSDLYGQDNKKSAKIANCTRSASEKLSNHNLSGDKIVPELEKLTDSSKFTDEKKELGDVNYINGNGNTDIQLTSDQCHRETIVYQHADPDKGFVLFQDLIKTISEKPGFLSKSNQASENYVVQLTDHHHHHHHHHSKQSRESKSVIMMIVTGDGMHNFFDGLAIGVAFAGSGVGGGLSTSVAILCHELPHEIGDFAVLLNAGLSIKRAVMYNTLSAFMCLIGMTVGVIIGKMDTGLLSAIIAGMFLYIALVNMIPQLDCCPTQSGTTRAFKLSIQLIGISIGVAIMCGISIYETSLQTLLN